MGGGVDGMERDRGRYTISPDLDLFRRCDSLGREKNGFCMVLQRILYYFFHQRSQVVDVSKVQFRVRVYRDRDDKGSIILFLGSVRLAELYIILVVSSNPYFGAYVPQGRPAQVLRYLGFGVEVEDIIVREGEGPGIGQGAPDEGFEGGQGDGARGVDDVDALGGFDGWRIGVKEVCDGEYGGCV